MKSLSHSRLLIILLLLLCAGFLATTLIGYFSALNTLRSGIVQSELPLTSDNVYSEIQRDLVRPVLIASMMASDTFLHDWIKQGERDPAQIGRYLQEIQRRYGAFTSFFVSEHTHTYFQSRGILKQVRADEPRDAWYFRVKNMGEPYEVNVDIDMANQDSMAFFINYRVLDEQGQFLGATGVGLSVDSVTQLIVQYQKRYNRSIFLVSPQGKVVLTASQDGPLQLRAGKALSDLDSLEGLLAQMPTPVDGNYQYSYQNANHYLNVRFIPELKVFLFVDQDDSKQLAKLQQSLGVSLALCFLVTLVILGLVAFALRGYQKRLEHLAASDPLTGLANRRGFWLLALQSCATARRLQQPQALLMLDLDHFKELNDTHGHQAGDLVLQGLADFLRTQLRESDVLCRFGGEEFLLLLRDSDLAKARQIADKLRRELARQHFFYEDKALQVTASIGITELLGASDVQAALSRADQALYRAKNNGRNRIESEPNLEAAS